MNTALGGARRSGRWQLNTALGGARGSGRWQFNTDHEQTHLNRVCFFLLFDAFRAFKGSGYSGLTRSIYFTKLSVNVAPQDKTLLFIEDGNTIKKNLVISDQYGETFQYDYTEI